MQNNNHLIFFGGVRLGFCLGLRVYGCRIREFGVVVRVWDTRIILPSGSSLTTALRPQITIEASQLKSFQARLNLAAHKP